MTQHPLEDFGAVNLHYPQLAYAHGGPIASGRIRACFDDFEVNERLGFSSSGDGEHVLLLIEKRGENTEYVAERLAKFLEIHRRAIGFAGLKDRNAVTSQWFSVQLPGRETPLWREFESESIRILESHRHHRKLRTGALSSNSFNILIRDLGDSNHELFDERLRVISADGLPNYFGPQRFGVQEQNINRAAKLFEGKWKVSNRHKRGLYLSAARSYLFNEVLSSRVTNATWNVANPGDAFNLDGARAFFKPDRIDAEIDQRLQTMEIHPTGVLWGRGSRVVTDQVLDIESTICDRFSSICEGLEKFGLEMNRRSLRLRVNDLAWEFPYRDQLRLKFRLAPGCYATSVLREIIEVRSD